MADDESPLIKALPPESDYLTYLTIIEYNLSLENLPILHRVLQDETLTTNIGWDLVHLLAPYLPESEQCLQEIARLGNPREVILKVTESLRLIDYDGLKDDEDEDGTFALESGDSRDHADSSTHPLKTAPTAESSSQPGTSQGVELPPPLPLPVNQFIALLGMLATLHPRIKTKYPSRFMSTTLQAILASFSNSSAHREEMINAIVKFVSVVSGSKRPPLPNRSSSSMRLTGRATQSAAPAGDPEAFAGDWTSPGESALQRKLLQSFITHVLAEYMLNLESADEDLPGMAWCSRIMEKVHPERTIPERQTLTDRFKSEERLHRRIDAVGQLVTLAQDLKLSNEELLDAAVAAEEVPDQDGGDEDDPPETPEDIALSRLGSLLLYTARQAATLLYASTAARRDSFFAVFPNHQEVLKNCLSSLGNSSGNVGTEPEALIDAVLALALLCLDNDAIGEPHADEDFNEYLQVTALLSSNCPSPNLRGHAHYVTSTILRSHPDDKVRLAFIRDTLEHCPFENLKVSAVGWVKGETIEANPPWLTDPAHHHASPVGEEETEGEEEEHSLFASPVALDTLAPYLWPDLHEALLTPPIRDAYLTFRTDLSFYLASLNFLYLLACANHLHRQTGIREICTRNDVSGGFLQPLRGMRARILEAFEGQGRLSEERNAETLAELNVLDETLARVTKAAAAGLA